VQLSDHSLTQKQAITFTTFTVFGFAALLLGLALIIYAHYQVHRGHAVSGHSAEHFSHKAV